jgi:hypothetical protein
MKRTSRYLICGILPLCLNSIATGLPFTIPGPDAQGPTGALLSFSENLDGPSPLNGLLPPWLDVPHAIDGGAGYSPLEEPELDTTRSQVASLALATSNLRDLVLRPEASLRNLGPTASDQEGPPEAMAGHMDPANTPVSISEPMGRTLILLGLMGLVLRNHRGGALTWVRNQTKPFLRFHGFWWAMTRS